MADVITFPRFLNRTLGPDTTKISGRMTALEMIAEVRKMNPNAKLIPYTRTYYAAVAEYNRTIVNSMERPPVPDWFCGSVDPNSGLLVNTNMMNDRENDVAAFNNGDVSKNDENNNEYPWDTCVVGGDSPGTPDYINCAENNFVNTNPDGESFWDDFMVGDLQLEESEEDEEGGEEGGGGGNRCNYGNPTSSVIHRKRNGSRWCSCPSGYKVAGGNSSFGELCYRTSSVEKSRNSRPSWR